MKWPTMVTLAALVILAAAWGALAAGDFVLSWWTVDAGGQAFSTGGGYALGGTVGQPDAGLLTGGEYALGGGFWGGGVVTISHKIYLPIVVRSG
ncbi:MAG: hypothetical protein PVI07_18365 [Anaerolineae bacterium]|jgi:hypothetical protein